MVLDMFLSLLQTTSSQVIYSSALTSWCKQRWRRKLKSHLTLYTRKRFSNSCGTGRGLLFHVRNLENAPFRQISLSFVTSTKNPPFASCPFYLYHDRGPHIEKKIFLMTLLNKLRSVCIKFVLMFGNFITAFIQNYIPICLSLAKNTPINFALSHPPPAVEYPLFTRTLGGNPARNNVYGVIKKTQE